MKMSACRCDGDGDLRDPGRSINRLRTFDQNAHSFNNEQFKLTLEKATSRKAAPGSGWTC
jgi:hypothetical protein